MNCLDKNSSVHRDLFGSLNDDFGLHFDRSPANNEPDDIASSEDAILRFSVDTHLPVVNIAQCIQYINDAQACIKKGLYGSAIARFKDLIIYVQALPFMNAEDRMTIADVIFVKSLAHERISFCQLLKGNQCLALKHAHLSILEHSSNPQTHLWRSIAFRRSNSIAKSLKSMTVFVALNTAGGWYNQNPSEQKIIYKYWQKIFEKIQNCSSNMKVQYFPLNKLSDLSEQQQREAMSECQLFTHPTFNFLIHADATNLHMVPGMDKTSFLDGISVCKQAFSFCQPFDDCIYFSKTLSSSVARESTTSLAASLNRNQARAIWETALFLNCTNAMLSLLPGQGIYEHLTYCMTLVRDQYYQEVVGEFESILADLSIIPLLPEREWSQQIAAEVDECADRINSLTEAIQHQMDDEQEATVHIYGIKLWLEHCERKFRAKKFKEIQLSQQIIRPKNCKGSCNKGMKSDRSPFGML